MAIMEHERAVLQAPNPSEVLESGDVGVVVHVYLMVWRTKSSLSLWMATLRPL
jgi:hypothetical protein